MNFAHSLSSTDAHATDVLLSTRSSLILAGEVLALLGLVKLIA